MSPAVAFSLWLLAIWVAASVGMAVTALIILIRRDARRRR